MRQKTTAMQLNAQKIDIIEMLIGIDNEKTLSEISSFVRQSTHDDFERIPGLPYTREERIAAIQRAEEDFAAGRFVTSKELKAKHPRI